MTNRIKQERYRKPGTLEMMTIPLEAWRNNQQEVDELIHPSIQEKRNASRLQKYFRRNKGFNEQVMTMQVTDDEIIRAIATLSNKKSVGKDGITAEATQQNQKWALPILKLITRNCQISHSVQKQWLRGIMTFIPKGKKRKDNDS